MILVNKVIKAVHFVLKLICAYLIDVISGMLESVTLFWIGEVE